MQKPSVSMAAIMAVHAEKLREVETFLANINTYNDYDPRCLAIARTKIEEAGMWLDKAVLQTKKRKEGDKETFDDL